MDPPPWLKSFSRADAWQAALVYAGLLLGAALVAPALVRRLRRRCAACEARAAAVLSRPVELRDAATVALAVLDLQIFVLIAAELAPECPPALWLIVNTLSCDVTGLALLTLLLRRRRQSWSAAFGGSWRRAVPDAAAGVLAYVALLPAFLLTAFACQSVLDLCGYPSAMQPLAALLAESDSAWVRAAVFVAAAGIAPVFEEAFFRGLWLPVLARRFGPARAIALTSLAFGQLHFHVPSLLPLMVVSAGFSLAYLCTGSLVTSIVMHAIFNAVNMGIILGMT